MRGLNNRQNKTPQLAIKKRMKPVLKANLKSPLKKPSRYPGM